MTRSMVLFVAVLLVAAFLFASSDAAAQQAARPVGAISGRIIEVNSGRPIASVTVIVEGAPGGALSDSLGVFRLANVPAGEQTLRAQRIGFAPAHLRVVVPINGNVVQLVTMARNALELAGVEVLAEPTGRARGELGTATVIEAEAIRNQTAASLAGILELVPGVVIQPPGLDNVQQISLRSVPVSAGSGSGDRSAETLAAFGTLIVLDGVPLSNNANLQSLGSNSGLNFSSSSGGGIDLRRIPATTLERVEVIRGVPSARFGDLTQGAIIVDTRAGAVQPEASLRIDERTKEFGFAGGRDFSKSQTAALTANIARTRVSAVTSDNQSTRVAAQFAHRFTRADPNGIAPKLSDDARFVMDTRAEMYQLTDDRPEQQALPGIASRSRDVGGRLSERLRLRIGSSARLEFTGAIERQQQRSFATSNVIRGATPVTDRTTAGRSVGRYLGGLYNARLDVEGDPSMFYSRLEFKSSPSTLLGFGHDFRLGTELRREGNSGEGYQFDIEFPPGSQFNGVKGFDRPRAFSAIPSVATSAFYVDDRMSRSIADMLVNIQFGIRADLLHNGSGFSGLRDVEIQPRLNIEAAPADWIRLRGGFGRVAKVPSLADLSPSLEYYDVINVNFFANDPAERLAVLTTSTFDPTNSELGYSVATKSELGFEMRFASGRATLAMTAFRDRIDGAVGVRQEATFIRRDHFNLTNTTSGSGKPPVLVEPAASFDSVPVLIDRPANNTTEWSNGVELTATLPELTPLKTRIAFQGALVKSRVFKEGTEFSSSFDTFQVSGNQARSPFYESIARTGERMLLTTRVVHHQPAVGLVITGTIQHTLREIRQNIGATDTLAFVGYITRGGSLVRVPLANRNLPEFADLRFRRGGIFNERQTSAPDWIFSAQVSKTLPLNGTLSFYAFNAFDKTGSFGSLSRAQRFYSPTRFGVELRMPLNGLMP